MHMRQNYCGLRGRFYYAMHIEFPDYVYGPEWFRTQPPRPNNALTMWRLWRFDLADRRWRLSRQSRQQPGCGQYGIHSQFGMAQSDKVCGGWDVFGVYDPAADDWQMRIPETLPPPPTGESFAHVLCEERGEVFAWARRDAADPTGSTTWLYDISENQWRELRPKRSPPPWRSDRPNMAGILIWVPDADVVLAMVRRDEEPRYPIEWVYSFKHNTWAPLPTKVQPGDRAFPRTDVWEKMIYSRRLRTFFRTAGCYGKVRTWMLRPDFSQVPW
jgi:hypothetical protein